MEISKEKFVEVIKEIRKVIASDECAECSCPNIRCELHGDCYNCIIEADVNGVRLAQMIE
jgi:hypothetical protein